MRFLYVIRFKERKNGQGSGFNGTKSFKTVARSPKAASKKMRKKGQIVSVRKVKKVMS